MKKIGLISNNKNLKAINIAKEIYDQLKSRNIDVLLLTEDTMPAKFNLPTISMENLSAQIDYLISVGGDGTFLRAARYCFKRQIPIMGINVGNLGFLAEVNVKNYERAVRDLLSNSFKIEERMLIELDICRADMKMDNLPEPIIALNEFVVTRNMTGKILDLEIIVNNYSFLNFRADGIIIATPTGSTAYSLSAGGPIVEPANEAFILTPLCAHSLFTRSIIISPRNNLEVKLKTKNKGDLLSADGVKQKPEFKNGDLLQFRQSKLKLKLITFNNNIFFRVFKEKLLK